MGNSDTYNGYAMTWDGRQLMEMNMNGGQFKYTFTYNDEGLRTSKTASGVTHKYVWEGSTLVSESWGIHLLIYLYDESGSPIGLQYRTTSYAEGVFDTYYFEKNLFGDIVAVYNASGTKIGSYTYDAWGNCTVTLNSAATTADKRIVRNYNPFRYRGYYYDTETGLYYLQSRYYNPTTGRFVNADRYVNANGDLIGFNMYAYCSNNPVMKTDSTGEMGAFLELGASLLSYICVAATAIFDKEVREDMNRINWNPFNSDEEAVIASNKVSFYKGQFVIREDWAITDGRSGSFVIMFLNSNAKNNEDGINTVKHEWGHFAQLALMDPIAYLLSVGLPSAMSGDQAPRDYYSNPWERIPDLFGGVDRECGYKSSSVAWGIAQFFAPIPVAILYELFGD